jgi:ABC-2 type transport system ATP-binding protein
MSSNAEIAIKIDDVSKLFRKQNQRTFKELIPALLGRKKVVESFWALEGINFEVKKGETLGIIGPNGSGKSTLLKLIAGVSQPTNGTVTVNGRIAPLIELGAGFHPELSGRENVYLNGIILGMTRKQVTEKFKEIVDFAELWDFIDQPVKHYSSGMYLRLAFAVAVHTDPEILLVDEILAVGDASFQEKCLAKMRSFQQSGVTIIIISHSSELIRQFTTRAVLLSKGKQIAASDSDTIVDTYTYSDLNKVHEEETQPDPNDVNPFVHIQDSPIFLTGCDFIHSITHEPVKRVKSGDKVSVRIYYHAKHDLPGTIFGISIYSDDGNQLFGTNTQLLHEKTDVRRGRGYYDFEINTSSIREGKLLFSPAIARDDLKIYQWHDKKYALRVHGEGNAVGWLQFLE